jgi:glycosyltransferase involved in cell wall biosynthesis
MKPLRIGYLTSIDAENKKSWSGIHYFISQSLQKHCGDVIFLGPKQLKRELFFGKIKSFLANKLIHKRFDYLHSIALSKAFGNYFNSKISGLNLDVIFVVAASTEAAFINTSTPIVLISDTTFFNMINYYPAYSNLLNSSKKQGLLIEQNVIKKASLLLYPSSWAANSAIENFGADKNKVHVIPFGANIEVEPMLHHTNYNTKNKKCKLLFLGVDWNRKGGDIAFNVLLKLNNEYKLDTTLTVCGCTPPANISHPNLITIPFLDKNIQQDREKFNSILSQHDLLILPTKAECFGIVFCEASAYGMPSVASNTGGISGAIANGINGFLIDDFSSADAFAKKIFEIYSDEILFEKLKTSSRNYYETNLNWDAWGKSVKQKLQTLLN